MGSELTDVMPGAEETYLSGKKRAGGEENGTREGSCPGEVRKRAVARRGAGASIYRQMLRVSICASDFSSQRKKWGESFEGLLLPIALMPFDGREKKIQHFSESRLGLQMLIALESVCLYTLGVKSSSSAFAQLLT